MRWLILTLVLLVAFLLGLAAAGAMLPEKHSVSRSITLHQTPETVWQVLTDHANDPKWRADVGTVVRIADRNGHPVWEERYKNGQVMRIETTVENPPSRMERLIVDQTMFGGVWIYEVSSADDSAHPGQKLTTVKITENGEVHNPVFRFLARFVFGLETTVETYLKALAAKFGEKAEWPKK